MGLGGRFNRSAGIFNFVVTYLESKNLGIVSLVQCEVIVLSMS